MFTYTFEVYPLAVENNVPVEQVQVKADSLPTAQSILYQLYGYTHWVEELPLKVE